MLTRERFGSLEIESIDVVAHRPGRKPTRARITDEALIHEIQRACFSASEATCHMESFTGPKYFLRLLGEHRKVLGLLEVQAHVAIIDDLVLHLPDRRLWTLVDRGFRHSSVRARMLQLAKPASKGASKRPRSGTRSAHAALLSKKK